MPADKRRMRHRLRVRSGGGDSPMWCHWKSGPAGAAVRGGTSPRRLLAASHDGRIRGGGRNAAPRCSPCRRSPPAVRRLRRAPMNGTRPPARRPRHARAMPAVGGAHVHAYQHGPHVVRRHQFSGEIPGVRLFLGDQEHLALAPEQPLQSGPAVQTRPVLAHRRLPRPGVLGERTIWPSTAKWNSMR